MAFDQSNQIGEINSIALEGFNSRNAVFGPAAAFVNGVGQFVVAIQAVLADQGHFFSG